jgi:hypothetical protein
MMAGLLEKLWDDVLAGPQPDKGLKKLRKKAMPSPDGALPGDNGLFPYCFYGAAGFLSVLVPHLAGKRLSRSLILAKQLQAAVEERRTGCLVCG